MLSEQLNDRRKLVEVCYKKNIGHLTSALSFIDVWHEFNTDIKDNALVIGNANTPVLFNGFYEKTIDELCNDINLYPNMNTTKCNYTSISLGNALGIAAGIALSKKYDTTYITIGDSILHSGTELEAAMYIGNNFNCMSKVVLIVNANNTGCISTFQNFNLQLHDVFKSFKWNVQYADGHNYESIKTAKSVIKNDDRPICILCRTVKGSGIRFIEDNITDWHYKTLNESDYRRALECLNEK